MALRPSLLPLLAFLLHLFGQALSQTCPHGCACLSGRVQCDPTRQAFDRPWLFNTSMPSPLPSSALELILTNNELRTLSNSALSPLTSLSFLDASFNILKSLPGDAFDGLVNLRTLKLSNNNLRTLPVVIFNSLSNLTLLDLSNNWLAGFPDGIFSPLKPTVLTTSSFGGNFFSCDCTQAIVLASVPVTCHQPVSVKGQLSTTVYATGDPGCTPPTLSNAPQASTVNTTQSVQLHCGVSADPPGTVTWYKDDQPLLLDHSHSTVTRQWSLVVNSALHSDAGSYYCNATNAVGFLESQPVQLTVLEITCFDGLLSSHETDVDCGGQYCTPCQNNKRCTVDSDCSVGHVCLGHHTLRSGLLYISKTNSEYLTCGVQGIPPNNLARRLRGSLRGRTGPLPNLNASDSLSSILTEIQNELATQLKVSRTMMNNFRLQAEERHTEPLYRLEFRMTSSSVRTSLETQLHAGQLGGTLTFNSENDVALTL